MVTVIARRTEDAGHRPLPKDVVRFRAKSFVSHLTPMGIHPDNYDRIYEIAALIYNESDDSGPFGVDHMIKAAKRFLEASREYVVYRKPERKVMVSCTTCQGSKISYKMDGKAITGINRNPDGTVKKCGDCAE